MNATAHAFNIRLPDSSRHAYAQKYCFLHGPDRELNRALRREVVASKVPLSEERDADKLASVSWEELQRVETSLREMLKVPAELRIADDTLERWIPDLGWKIATLPADAKSVLILGSASGREALFVRHQLPDARIVVADFEDERLPNLERALGVEFYQGDFNELLANNPSSFDVVFSNHVLEHLFDPARTLQLSKHALRPGGRLISALPLDGQPRAPFSGVLNVTELHPLDMCTVDVAHAWKTNISELTRELRASGFRELSFRGRDKFFSAAERTYPSRAAFERRARVGLVLNRALFGTTRAALKKVFPHEAPYWLVRACFGLEQRVWFGSNRLKNEFSLEALVVAR
jgi:SAM-dependent methyltransferase